MKHLRIVFLIMIAGMGGSVFGAADPAETLMGTVDAALDVVYGEGSSSTTIEEKQVQVRAVIESQYELDVIIRRAIGRNWRLLKEEEQAQVLELVKQLVIKAYVKGLDGTERPELTFGETVQISDKRLEIPSLIVSNGQKYRVVYRMGLMRSGWQIYDIVAEDISVVSNYRQQFDDHFREGSGAELIVKLEKLLEKEDLDEKVEL